MVHYLQRIHVVNNMTFSSNIIINPFIQQLAILIADSQLNSEQSFITKINEFLFGFFNIRKIQISKDSSNLFINLHVIFNQQNYLHNLNLTKFNEESIGFTPSSIWTFSNNKKLLWTDFKGQVDEKLPWSAHIFWSIDYVITDYQKKKVSVNLRITKNSWVRQEKKCNHLLNHQQGHYLIGALCCLQFLRRVDKKKKYSNKKFQDLVLGTFDRTIMEYLVLQKKYDEQTQHRLNYKKQQFWDEFIYERLQYYVHIFDSKKNKFVNLQQSQKDKAVNKTK